MQLNFYIDSCEVCQYGPSLPSTDERQKYFNTLILFKVIRWCNVYEKKALTNWIRHVHSCFTDTFAIIWAKLYTSAESRQLVLKTKPTVHWTVDTAGMRQKVFSTLFEGTWIWDYFAVVGFFFNTRKKGRWNSIWGNCLPLRNANISD